MCRWMGSRFHGWIDYNGVTFLVELLEWDRAMKILLSRDFNIGRFTVKKWFVLLFQNLTVRRPALKSVHEITT